MHPGYRVRQFFHHLSARTDPDHLATAAEVLDPGLLLLFRAMAAADQAHGIRVLETLRSAGETHPDLLAAALLHDVGKASHPLPGWQRAMTVLLSRLLPSLTARWGQGPARNWRRPFAVSQQHPAWGAQMVSAAGGSERLVELIRHHQDQAGGNDHELQRQLQVLRFADDRN